jgi:hypothetical protein
LFFAYLLRTARSGTKGAVVVKVRGGGSDRGARQADHDSLEGFDDITVVEREDPTAIRSSAPGIKNT